MTITNSGQKLKPKTSGTSLSAESFRLLECVREPDPQGLLDLLTGVRPVMRVTGVVAPRDCDAIADNFARACRKRGDEVPADRIGADHYGKSTSLYLDECAAAAPDVDALLAGTVNPVAALKEKIGRILRRKGELAFRAAGHDSRVAAEFRAMRFTGHGQQFALEPHDDQAQLRHPDQAGFEIQQVTYPVAVNQYLRVPRTGGGLRVWNIRPDDECRKRLGLEFTGYPYPTDSLLGVESFVVHLRPGDCVFLSGAHVHAVEQTNGDERIIISFFMGQTGGNEVLWWT